MSEPRDYTPKPHTCILCAHFMPEIIYTHKGVPLTLWDGLCTLRPVTRCAQTDTCPLWQKK